jgi:prepilin-type processing-associated H-X9-DG protein
MDTLRRGVTQVELLVIIGIIGVLMGLSIPAVQKVRYASARMQCANNMRQIGLALHQYHYSYNRFPPGVSSKGSVDPYPYMSWSTRLLPYIEKDSSWAQAQQAFAKSPSFFLNPPHTCLATVMPIFGCPADNRTYDVGVVNDVKVAFTSYLGVSGSNQFRKDGLLYLDSHVRFSDVADGTSVTLFIGERPPSADGMLGWWYGGWGQSMDGSGDCVLSVRERNVSSYGKGCPFGPYLFGPGRVNNQCDAFHYWSLHTGSGANFVFVDGSVQFIHYSAANVMPALATRAGNDFVPLPE